MKKTSLAETEVKEKTSVREKSEKQAERLWKEVTKKVRVYLLL